MLLLSIFLLPLIGALILCLTKIDHKSISFRFISLFFSILPFLFSIIALVQFDHTNSNFQFITVIVQDVSFGLDGISLLFLLLTTFLFLICTIYNCKINYTDLKSYIALFLLLESLIIGFFISLNAISFYIFFESVLIPMFFIIGKWGSKERVYATFKLFLYTLTGSLFFLLGLVYIYSTFDTLNIQKLTILVPDLDLQIQALLWLAFFVAFAIKVPMFPFHTWLPDAHVQSPTSGSVILASILIKMGGYGFLRFSIPMLPAASLHFSNLVIVLSIIAVIYTSLIAFAQTDIKKLIAYSSIAHMGVVTAGIFSFNEEGILGSIFQMISHGLISPALFLCVGMLYTRTNTLEVKKYSGIVTTMPKFALLFVLFSMASIGLPGTSGFIGEFLSMLGIFHNIKFTAGFIILGVILSAIYMLSLCKKIIWGVNCSNLDDLNKTELFIITSLAIFVILFGFYPTFLLNYLELYVRNLVIGYNI